METATEALKQDLGCCLDDGIAAVSLTATRTDIFGRGTNGGIWRRTCNAPTCSPTQWSAWASEPGAPPPGAQDRPAAISMRSGRIDVFVRGGDNALWQRAWFSTSGWSAWQKLSSSGPIVSGPGVSSTGSNSLDVWATSTDNEVVYRRCTNYTNQCIGNSAFGAWQSAGTPEPGIHATHAEPAVAWLGGQTLNLFVTGADSALYARRYIAGSWDAWESKGGVIWSSPAVPPDRPDVYVRGTDDRLWRNTLFVGWEQLPQYGHMPFVKSAVAVAGKSPVIDVFGIDPATSNAWELTCSNTTYDPERWNDFFCGGDGCGGDIQLNNNCYNYAVDRVTGTFAQPGLFSGQEHTADTVAAVRTAALADGLRWVGWNFPGNAFNCNGGHLVHLGVKPNDDYHWWRLDRVQGTWSHKRGDDPAMNVDFGGQTITNPLTSNRGGYTDNGGFYCACGDLGTIY